MGQQVEWSPDQLAQMCWATNPHTGRPTKLRLTPELEGDYLEWLNADCEHLEVAIVRLLLRNGADQYRRQCLDCGKPFGTPIKKKDVPNIDDVPLGSVDEHLKYERDRFAELEELKQRNVERQFQAGPGSSEYQEYLRSPEWQAKRQAVMRRANDICEGCGLAPATEVHHFTYDNIYQEFLWDLAALCRRCHERQHPGMAVKED